MSSTTSFLTPVDGGRRAGRGRRWFEIRHLGLLLHGLDVVGGFSKNGNEFAMHSII
jgi:hypothetical protein